MDSAFSEEKLVDWTQGVSRLKESAFPSRPHLNADLAFEASMRRDSRVCYSRVCCSCNATPAFAIPASGISCNATLASATLASATLASLSQICVYLCSLFLSNTFSLHLIIFRGACASSRDFRVVGFSEI